MVNKKGQEAMEFLMTYGWAILVVLASIGILTYLGLPNKNTETTESICNNFCLEKNLTCKINWNTFECLNNTNTNIIKNTENYSIEKTNSGNIYIVRFK